MNEPEDFLSRTKALLGREALTRLAVSNVAVFGLGGVGSYACEALARSGVGSFSLFDFDRVSISNMNRQIIATTETVGRHKTEVMRERILSINPHARVEISTAFFSPENADALSLTCYDYVVDAIDTVSSKIALILKAKEENVPIISAMGAGNKLHGEALTVMDLFETKEDPLARVMRRELKKQGVSRLKVVASLEKPVKKLRPPGSVSFVPPVAGLLMAGEVVRDLSQL